MTTEIENTRRQMYADLKRFQSMVGSTHLFKTFQDSLEAHLEELRKANSGLVEGFAQQHADIGVRLANMTEERDQIQQRLHAIDHAYNEQQKAMGIAGEELIRVQGIARQQLDEIAAIRTQHGILSDAYEHQKQLTRSACVAERESWVQIRELTGLVTNQRQAIADMHMAGRSAKSAIATLQRLGYTDCGGQLWKPPLGKKPHFDEWCIDPRCVHCRARAGGPGACSVAIVSNGAGYPESGAGAVNHGVGAGVRPGVGAGGSGSGGGAGRATGR